jgi:hypothetical protein
MKGAPEVVKDLLGEWGREGESPWEARQICPAIML